MIALRGRGVRAGDTDAVIDIGVTPELFILMTCFFPTGFAATQFWRPDFDIECVLRVIDEHNFLTPVLIYIHNGRCGANISSFPNVHLPSDFGIIASDERKEGIGCVAMDDDSEQVFVCTSFERCWRGGDAC